MTTREYYDGVVEDVLEELGFPTGDEAAVAAFRRKVAEVFGSLDDLYTELDSHVTAEARRRLAPAALAVMDADRDGEPVFAYVSLQVWRGDYAEEVGAVRFDARRALDQFDLAFIEELEVDNADYATDDVFNMACKLGLCGPHDGPFSCRLVDAEALAAYVEARRAREAAGGGR